MLITQIFNFKTEKTKSEPARWFHSLTSLTPSVEIWNLASASAKHGELMTLQIRSSPLPFLNANLSTNENKAPLS